MKTAIAYGSCLYATVVDEWGFASTHTECCSAVGSNYAEHVLG